MSMDVLPTRRWTRFVVILLLGLVLTACGADDGGDEPEATSAPGGAQPTVAVEDVGTPEAAPDDGAESTPTNTDMSDVPADVAEAAEDATPNPATAVAGGTPEVSPVMSTGEDATPSARLAVGGNATPVSGVAGATPGASGDQEAQTDAGPVVGDGTTGATVDATARATPAVAGASPAASPSAATPAAALTVTSCEVPDVPPFTGDQTVFALTTDVNFRTGPGADCDMALETPLGAFQQVEVIGGPVIRQDDRSEWVQVDVQGTQGWVSFEFLAPVE